MSHYECITIITIIIISVNMASSHISIKSFMKMRKHGHQVWNLGTPVLTVRTVDSSPFVLVSYSWVILDECDYFSSSSPAFLILCIRIVWFIVSNAFMKLRNTTKVSSSLFIPVSSSSRSEATSLVDLFFLNRFCWSTK